MASLTFKNIVKIYGKSEQKAVDNFNLEIQHGEFVVLVGPSGCGKSSILRMISGLEEITDGELLIDGQIINDVPPKDRDISMVFQNYALYPHLSVFNNIAFPLKLRKIIDPKTHKKRKLTKAEIQEAVMQTAKILNLDELLERKPRELSGGQKQRVALGRAIVRKPKVFLLDEPLSNLDAKLRTTMRGEIMRVYKNVQTTFIYVTHDQTEAMTMGDKIVVMDKGVIQQIGTPYEIFYKPKNIFVANFVGTPQINLLSAKLVKKNDSLFLNFLDKETEIEQNITPPISAEQDVVLGVRPQNAELVAPEDENAIEGTISDIELLGTELNLHLTLSNNETFLLTTKASKNDFFKQEFRQGAKVFFKIKTEGNIYFDPKSSQRL